MNATRFPDSCPGDKELPTINNIPDIARIIDAKVNLEIFSLKKNIQKLLKKWLVFEL